MIETTTLKRDNFVRLAERRTKVAMLAIRRVAKLGNRSAYVFSEADVEQIATTLERELDLLKIAMAPKKNGRADVEFRLVNTATLDQAPPERPAA